MSGSASMPSITGIAMSRRTRSTSWVVAASTASRPSTAWATTCQPVERFSITLLSSIRRSAESSTISTRMPASLSASTPYLLRRSGAAAHGHAGQQHPALGQLTDARPCLLGGVRDHAASVVVLLEVEGHLGGGRAPGRGFRGLPGGVVAADVPPLAGGVPLHRLLHREVGQHQAAH